MLASVIVRSGNCVNSRRRWHDLAACKTLASTSRLKPSQAARACIWGAGRPLRHRRDRSERLRGPPAVPRLAAHWARCGRTDSAVVRARPRGAQGVGKKTRQCSELRRAWRRGTRGARRRADERSRRSSTCQHRRPQCCCRRRHRWRWAAGHCWTVRSRRPPHASSRSRATTKTTMDDNPRP